MDEKKQKQIEEMCNIAHKAVLTYCGSRYCPCDRCSFKDEPITCDECAIAHELYNAGYRKQEWISVDERLPDTTLKRLIICDQDIGSGEVVNEEDGGMVQMSAIVAVISRRCTGGEVKQFFDFDQTIGGVWAHNMSVTHWMPLPEAPKMKGGAE